jgi:hypothetical protein
MNHVSSASLSQARKLLVNTPPEMIIESLHPRLPAFPSSEPFSRANKALKEPIDWSLTE